MRGFSDSMRSPMGVRAESENVATTMQQHRLIIEWTGSYEKSASGGLSVTLATGRAAVLRLPPARSGDQTS
jgi:hypothetical protein